MEAIDTRTIGKYKIDIIPDDSPESPREWDNLGTMICLNRKYSYLGDQNHDYNINDYNDENEFERDIIKRERPAVVLPLMVYDHSGITMYVGTTGDRWDSSFVGFIFISKEKARKEYGWKLITKARREKLEEYLRNEVKVYDQYLTGDVYGYRITDTGTDEEVDSCWGYYGSDECMDEAESIVNHIIEKDTYKLVV
jgi:hypothetical protein